MAAETPRREDMLFYPWGDLWQSQGSGGYEFANLPYRDVTTTTDLTTARISSPNFGRWFTPDPAGEGAVRLDDPQTWNMYAYVRNNPTTLTDPSGLESAESNGGRDPNAKVCVGDPNPCYEQHDDTNTNSPDAAKKEPESEKQDLKDGATTAAAGVAAIAMTPAVENATISTASSASATGSLTVLPLAPVAAGAAVAALAGIVITEVANTLVENYRGSEQLAAIESVVAVENQRARSMAAEHTKHPQKSKWDKHTKPRPGRGTTKDRQKPGWKPRTPPRPQDVEPDGN